MLSETHGGVIPVSNEAPAIEIEDSAAVGQSWKRTNAESKVMGTFRYTADLPVPKCLYLGVHRASQPHARIVHIDYEGALAVPGVIKVVTGADLHNVLGEEMMTGPAFSDQPPLAWQRVRYLGEPVAVVIATDLATARAAADEIFVEYEGLTPVLDIDAAVNGQVFVHSELRPSVIFQDLKHLSGRKETNVNYEYHLLLGDTDTGLQKAATTVTGEFWTPPTSHVAIELFNASAWIEDDRLELVSTTQTPSYVRQTIASMLHIRLNQVRVRTSALGGSFGSKMYDRLEPLVAAIAWTQKLPVRLELTREESFVLTTRHGVAVSSQMSADAEGNIVSASADVRYDTGAYADVGPRIAAKSGMVACGPYRIENARITSRCIYTNKPSAGPFRGFGVPQVTWSHESLIDELARNLEQDPAAFRRRNLLREGDMSPMGTVMHSADFVGCLDAVTDAVGWDEPMQRKAGNWRWGRGVAVGLKAVLTPTVSNAVLQLNQDSSATLLISTVEMGQGSDTIMAQIAADILYLSPGQIRVVSPDTDVTPYDTITAGSRSTYHSGNAVKKASENMRDRLVDMAAAQMRVSVSDCKLTSRGILSSSTQRIISIEELMLSQFGATGTTMTTEANFTTEWTPYDKESGQSSKVTEHWFAGAAAAEVAVDIRTGRIHIRHLAVAGDVGRAINPTLVRQQLAGGAIMGMGHALFDEIVFDEGQMINGTLLDYQLPSIKDLPDRLTPIIIENPHRNGPFGAKGVGETGIIPIAPAIANAVRDAIGVRITTLPLTPERVLNALAEQGK
ncbi:MAG: xanthine dehydrogenase family protein molybdopterin-binding subunit [Acidimicrobiaceae bacterium]|nr:xanthine dehydrogenase family protein molybdopterin-binding subunit [Acidimicrobiaceae bacterium]